MEENINRKDIQVNAVRQSSLRPSGSLKSTLSGRSTPRSSPSFRRLNSSRTPRREGRTNAGSFQWIRGNRLVYWLLLITLWTYLGFYVQSKWAHSDKEEFIGYESKRGISISGVHQNRSPDVVTGADLLSAKNASSEDPAQERKKASSLKNVTVSLVRKRKQVSVRRNVAVRKSRRSTSERSVRSNKGVKQKDVVDGQTPDLEEDIPRKNTSFGLIVGPFGKTEDSILGWSAEKRSGTCDRKGEFARIVWSRKFVLILHELSMTGAPLSMMELATELLSCGGTVSAVVLSKKGGLMGELTRRGIRVLKDKAELSYKTAMKADLVIAGSAVCSSWIEQYLAHFTAGSNQIVWWIMENRREYFDRSKQMLNRVKMLVFLSDSQSKQWLTWCQEEHIQLNFQPMLVPLSVNDELAFVAGIPCSLNTPSFTVEKMQEKRSFLRDAVRNEMGLTDRDMLVMSLSSINPGKGQRLLLESALLAIDQNSLENSTNKVLRGEGNISGTTDGRQHSRALFQNVKQYGDLGNELDQINGSGVTSKKSKRKFPRLGDLLSATSYPNIVNRTSDSTIRKMLSNSEERQGQNLKVLIGSIGSKSNKVLYVKGLLRFLSQHSELSKLVLWTPATTRVASLYAAADVYVINAQGLGETFGRVTIEAMAFGLPVLGTDAGGTQEIVEHNVTGLLHPLGHEGTQILSQNLRFLLSNPLAREKMGSKGRSKVEKMYLKHHMYKRFARVLYKCMRIK
ncbi:uncharacterized protein LOC131254853 [Magnolia sinica]|uniref:uncharacterized protein LOC131254853 n=1 Tax=Magnolia sinica TaxID=86752 RepID=UPI0026583A66|nr:uncharacterized protein LOC131254853 [Magnolia sinica]